MLLLRLKTLYHCNLKSRFREEGKNEVELTEDPNHQVDVENLALSQRRQARYGSGRLRTNRPRTPEGLPPVVIPEWFFKKNVLCAADDVSDGILGVYSGESGSEVNCRSSHPGGGYW